MQKKLLQIFILSFLFLTMQTSCEHRPDNVVSKSKMEQLLYDYHLAKSMINQLPFDEKYKSQLYIDAVMKKNGVTQAEFDSSLVWYNRHNSDLKDIYDNLGKRFEAADKELQLITGNTSMANVASSYGDTANIWNGTPIMVLRPVAPLNHESFIIKADTSFQRFDKFILAGNVSMISENNQSRNSNVVISLTIKYDDNKIVSDMRSIRHAGNQVFTVEARENKDIKSVSGFIHYNPSTNNERSMAIIDRITLIRMHKPDSLINNTISTDSLNSDKIDSTAFIKDSLKIVETDTVNKEQYLSPDELREQHRSEGDLKLKTAPDASKIKRRFNRGNNAPNKRQPLQRR